MVASAYMDNFRLGRLIKGRVSEFHEDNPGFWKVTLAKNYGSSWSSGNLVFGGGE